MKRGDEGPASVERAARLPAYYEPHWVILALFLFFVVARYISLGARRAVFEAMRIEFTLGLALTALSVMVLLQQPVSLRPFRNLLVAIVCLFLAMLVQLPFAADPLLAKTVFVDRVIKFAFLTFFMLALVHSPRYLNWFVMAYLFSCFYITQESVHGLISGGLVWENQGVMRLHGAVPIYMHPNSLGGLAMGAIPFAVFLFPVWREWWLRTFLAALLVTAIICVVYTGSRTAYVAFLGFLVYWGATSRSKGRWLGTALVLGVVALLLVPQQYKERFLSIGGHEAEGQSKAKRIEILSDAWRIFMENPGGVGVASFPAVRMRKFGRVQDTHNLYLEVATNLGAQGLIVFVFLVVVMLSAFRRVLHGYARQQRALRTVIRTGQPPPGMLRRMLKHEADLRLLQAVSRSAEAFIYVRLVLGMFGMDLYEVYWWFGAGMALALLRLNESTASRTARLVEMVGMNKTSAGRARKLT